jgi:type I restriction enzyme R subunit/putative DNA methylase
MKHVRLEVRASGIKPDATNPLRSGTHTRGYLPHVKREGARYFVTFRLVDSLPKVVLLKIQGERAEALRRLQAQQDVPAHLRMKSSPRFTLSLEQIEREYRRKVERYLDKGLGECWLRRPDIADLVAGALRFFEGQRYRLDAWVVMPNHVHVVFWPMPNCAVSSIVQSWKRQTAREANKILRRTGAAFWQPEPYDHWIRNDEEHARCCRYVMNNPATAGLCPRPEDWKWSSAWREAPGA